jgi:hypothetical protein
LYPAFGINFLHMSLFLFFAGLRLLFVAADARDVVRVVDVP